MKITIVSIYSFPYGLAPTNRILSYSKGLVANGHSVTVYMPFPTDRFNKVKLPTTGHFDGVKYLYTSGRYKSALKILRGFGVITGLRRLYGYITFFLHIYRESRKESIDCVIISTDTINNLLIFSIIAKVVNSKSVFIFDEFPNPIRSKLRSRIPFWKGKMYSKVLQLMDGYISISEELKKFYSSMCPKPTLILSAIIDVTRFLDEPKVVSFKNLGDYICYMGNMEITKDNVDLIIKAFSLIERKYPHIQLHLYGSPNEKTKQFLCLMIQELGLEQKVFIKGRANYDEVPIILKGAKVLVSSQPYTKRASGGFPTKFGEYLATGVPTLMCSVGENSSYFKDNVHAFFSRPDNYEEYAVKLEYILDNYDFALEVGRRGRDLVINEFSHFSQGKIVANFLLNIKK